MASIKRAVGPGAAPANQRMIRLPSDGTTVALPRAAPVSSARATASAVIGAPVFNADNSGGLVASSAASCGVSTSGGNTTVTVTRPV